MKRYTSKKDNISAHSDTEALLSGHNRHISKYDSMDDQSADEGYGTAGGYGTSYHKDGIDDSHMERELYNLNDNLYKDDFDDLQATTNRNVRTGRQRKKLAARSKGGEFQTKRKKRRIYFCCISSDIDVQGLYDYLITAGGLSNGWSYQLHHDVLHLYRSKSTVADSINTKPLVIPSPVKISSTINHIDVREPNNYTNIRRKNNEINELGSWEDDSLVYSPSSSLIPLSPRVNGIASDNSNLELVNNDKNNNDINNKRHESIDMTNTTSIIPEDNWIDTLKISDAGAQEVFVFDFGSTVFWGFSKGEEEELIKTIRMFVTKGQVIPSEFESGEDDMAFIINPELDAISIANDVISLPELTMVKQRLSVSFAIGQSTVLSIFESRVDLKVEQFKYIPEILATSGSLHLTGKELGIMIGEVFVIRHDVNLHTEILDTPDFFWKNEKYEVYYKLVMEYLEMSNRTDVLNKRLDMLKELLDVLQQQMENSHAVKLEWIVIWLIVMEVVLQILTVGGDSLGWFKRRDW